MPGYGLIQQGRLVLIAEAEATASRLLPTLRPPVGLPVSQRSAVLEALEAFTGRLMAELSAVGLMLEAAAESR
ncbi:hypothetical protein EBE87_27235 [Pseudoroseomonas wenyumeiae]|uniref:Uncharacterized protein n=1 Tax=Teichococcus wenyumeiae TaxID=2478470 RepID=A0A3A9J552_9PROT|nr:hypothetical protein [Pseudoroseomonas wenyumeiae]RKK01572.1 hypothetical protein D6Z83_24305 [Pseudoroseomonas wenyumeiae]RMI15089.1 hypothetical protein EBE87_27235 [Pseudoroseomonas wenyumeiae]